MSNRVKIWLIIAISLVATGSIIFGGAMTMFNWDFTKLETAKYETNDYTVSEKYNNITITTDTSDILFVATDETECRIECFEEKNVKHSVEVVENTLIIKLEKNKKWYEYVGINFKNTKITVYLPKGNYEKLSIKSQTGDIKIPKELKFDNIDITDNTGNVTNEASAKGDIKIKTSTGDISVRNISARSTELSVGTGKITAENVSCEGDLKTKVSTGKTVLDNIKCDNFASNGSTGDLAMKKVLALGKITITRDTGDVSFENSDAKEIFIETDTGMVCGSLLSDKVFIVNTDTGKVSVPKTVNGGSCEITTDTGDIKITIE